LSKLTPTIIKKYESEIDNWISEPDNGIADAMNKGIDLATGDYILFIHSDDYLVNSSVLERASEYLGDRFDIFFFKVLHDIIGQNQWAPVIRDNSVRESCSKGLVNLIRLLKLTWITT